MAAFLLCQCRFAAIVDKKANQPLKRPSECETFTRQFAMISANKDYVPDADRLVLCRRWGIIEQGISTVPVVTAANRFVLDRGDGPPPAEVLVPPPPQAQGGQQQGQQVAVVPQAQQGGRPPTPPVGNQQVQQPQNQQAQGQQQPQHQLQPRRGSGAQP